MAMFVASPGPAQELFVGDSAGQQVVVFSTSDSGNTPPARVIEGPSTGLNLPFGVAIDPLGGEVFASNLSGNSVTVYDWHADGDQSPSRTISGADTDLQSPIGMAVDLDRQWLYVMNLNRFLLVFDLDANGNVAPLGRVEGPETGLQGSNVVDVAIVASTDEVVAAIRDDDRLHFYPAGDFGDVAPSRVIKGPKTGLDSPFGITYDPVHDELYVAGDGRVLVFDAQASGDVAPLREFDDPDSTSAIKVAVDHEQDLVFVTSQTGQSISAYERTADGEVSPEFVISGGDTQLSNPTMIKLGRLDGVFTDRFEAGSEQ
jgi:DNA-binding beta-propeller fold protein YncE